MTQNWISNIKIFRDDITHCIQDAQHRLRNFNNHVMEHCDHKNADGSTAYVQSLTWSKCSICEHMKN